MQKSSRISTGVTRLDFLLKGGFFKGAMYVVQGSPGMGKTILANQVCFEAAKRGETSLFFSLQSESSGRLVGYLNAFKFADENVIGDKVHFINGYQVLRDEGASGFLELLKTSITQHKAKVLVIDGIDAVERTKGNEQIFREFIYSLQAFVDLAGCTTLLLTPVRSNRDAIPRPEQAIADGVIELGEHQNGPRAIREIQILKFRGSDFLKGRHEIEINENGLIIHPRTEVQFGRTLANHEEKRTRMKFGVPEFDKMLHGGLLSGSMTSLIGAPGTGKTTLGLSFLAEGAKVGEEGVYFGFYETPQRLMEKADALGIPLRKAVEKGLVELQWQQAVENITDSLAERLLERLRERKKEKIRVFIDGMSGFRKSLAYPERFGVFLSALTNELRNLDATTIYSEETELFSANLDIANKELGSVVDNVVYLRYVEMRSQLYRLISILKSRESSYDPAIREFIIGEKGVEVADSFKTAESILTGSAKVSAPMATKTDRRKK